MIEWNNGRELSSAGCCKVEQQRTHDTCNGATSGSRPCSPCGLPRPLHALGSPPRQGGDRRPGPLRAAARDAARHRFECIRTAGVSQCGLNYVKDCVKFVKGLLLSVKGAASHLKCNFRTLQQVDALHYILDNVCPNQSVEGEKLHGQLGKVFFN